jgi:hypothetical protein
MIVVKGPSRHSFHLKRGLHQALTFRVGLACAKAEQGLTLPVERRAPDAETLRGTFECGRRME